MSFAFDFAQSKHVLNVHLNAKVFKPSIKYMIYGELMGNFVLETKSLINFSNAKSMIFSVGLQMARGDQAILLLARLGSA